MTKIELINKELEEMGFTINGVEYKLEQTSTQNIIINGRRMVQEQKHYLYMEYIGDGCELDENNNDIEGTEFCGFDIKDENKCSLVTIYVSSANDFYRYLNI